MLVMASVDKLILFSQLMMTVVITNEVLCQEGTVTTKCFNNNKGDNIYQ